MSSTKEQQIVHLHTFSFTWLISTHTLPLKLQCNAKKPKHQTQKNHQQNTTCPAKNNKKPQKENLKEERQIPFSYGPTTNLRQM